MATICAGCQKATAWSHLSCWRCSASGAAAGGQGANSGILDVHNHSWKLAAVIKREAGQKLLEAYDVERLPVGTAAADASAMAADERGLISMNMSWKVLKGLPRRVLLSSGFGYIDSTESSAVIKESTWPLEGGTWKYGVSLAFVLIGPQIRLPGPACMNR